MKKTIYALIILLLPLAAFAQKQIDSTIAKSIIPVEKQELLKNVNLIANIRAAGNAYFDQDGFNNFRFQMEQFRLEFKGNISKRTFFRFRDRYTRPATSESVDNISRSTDLAFVEFQMKKDSEFWYLSFGKMCADWGGFEFDTNPIFIYQYTDFIDAADNFLTGIGSRFNLNKQHSISLQVLNTRTKSFDELYPGDVGLIQESKAPLAYIANWRGNLFKDKLQTIWSYSLFNEAKNYFINYASFGLQFTPSKRFQIQFDYKWCDEQLDREGIITNYITSGTAYDDRTAQNTVYNSYWTRIDFRLIPKVNLFFVGFIDKGRWDKANTYYANADSKQDIYTGYCYIPGIEILPSKDLNIKIFVSYVGHDYRFTDFAKSSLNNSNYSNNRFTFGISTPLVFL
ncbi:OprO/OprP family phosphate-selective porin [Solitalea sp. MAHUQ-68]|uniref:OprO/OprP family phosphate-selective porin n=1 Tax=Solitalea agri TaxID=2953739 RepID=A0A9X2EYC5_9SPHI|nr:porin [Solitalea agri]MCO4291242.1 OprO/OprP family phosphate-selective porin [Solitalea agri]